MSKAMIIQKFTIRILFLIIILISSFSCFSQIKRSKDLLPTNQFHKGEIARYKIIYKLSEAWVTAGNLSFEFSERAVDSQLHIVCIARGNTSPAFDFLYKVRDEYATVLEPHSFSPKFFLRRVSEGGFKIHNDFNFNFENLNVIAEMQDTKHPHRVDTLKIAPNTQDIVSAILYCRSLNYAKLDSGGQFQFPVFLDNELFQVGIKYLGKQEISTEMGDFKCLVLQPLLLSGRIFTETDKMRIYITDDERRLPVYIESPLRVGKVIAILTKYNK
jgi:hypothetical protein